MTRWRHLFLSLLAVGLSPAAAEAQHGSELAAILKMPGALQSRVRFDHLTSADGLSQDSVFTILQDRKGFLWFGTQAGLNRYDGYRVTQFRHDPANPNSIPTDFVQLLLEDSEGGLWMGSLTRFDPRTEKFTTFAIPQRDPATGSPLSLQRICEDRSGFLWLGMHTGKMLYRLDPHTGKITGFDIGGALPWGPDTGVYSMYRDPAGILWLGASYGLIRFDPSTGAATHFTQGGPIPTHVSIRGIAGDVAGKFWLATTQGGQNFFDPVAGAFARRWGAPDPEHLKRETTAILAGADGVLWLATGDGLEVYDPATGGHAILRHNAADRHSLGANEILSLAADRDGNVWVGVKGGGANRFSPGSLRFGPWRRNPSDPNSLSDDNVRALYRDRAGVVWIGTYGGGLDRFDPVSGTFRHFRHDPRKPASLDDDRVYSIYEDRSGDLWVGTSTGINRLDRRTGAFEHFNRGPLDKGGEGIPTYSLLEDSRGAFWFGAGEARAALDRRTGAVTSLARTGGLSMHEDRGGNLWTFSSGGFTRMDASGNVHGIAFPKTATNKPPPVQINFIHEDAQGWLWLATEAGLFRFDPKSEEYTGYTTREGLPDNVVQCALRDKADNLWLSTNNGISRFNPRDSSFTNYHESDGLQSEQFNRKACFVDPVGIMYFGGLHGFNVFDPSKIPPPREPSQVVLTELRIGGNTVHVRTGSVLPRPVWEMDALSLSHKDDELSLEFAALSYRDQARTRYRFRMDSLEDRWTEVDSRNRSARYTGLRPGHYRFHVQSSTDGRTWSRQEAALRISIAPPWWMTTWSQAGAILAGMSLLFGAYRLRVRALRERGLRLEKLVDQRTVELVEARDQAEQANRAKSAFLANMSHELRTPLNAILGFSGILREHSASEEQRRDLDIINRSGEHLLTLINDVLDVAKIEAGRTVLEITPCDLKALVRDVADMMRVRAAEKHLELALVESAEVPRYVQADAAKLREVLINLVGNAIKYTERGSVRLLVDARAGDKGEQVVLTFEVEDTGIGIAREDLERVFRPFEQVARGANAKGTGLGLAITRQVLGLMGGHIEVESTPGKGSCFRVELPVERAQEVDVKPIAGHERILGLEAGQPEYRILVVEDERENSMVLERLLREAGFSVRVAEHGKQGVASFREWRPQFIWMDLRMPVMDGMKAATRIRELDGGGDVKIAAVTASGFDSKRSEVMAAGFDDYLSKPYRPDEIFECMERLLGVRYRRAEAAAPSVVAPAGELRPEAIAALPDALRTELRDAIVALDVQRISRTIERVTEHDAALGRVLAGYAKGYTFTAILVAVEGAQEESPSRKG